MENILTLYARINARPCVRARTHTYINPYIHTHDMHDAIGG